MSYNEQYYYIQKNQQTFITAYDFYNTIGYLIGDGFRNVLKNKKSTASCLIIMCAAMLIFGIFFVIGENISHIMKIVTEEQGIQVFLKSDVSDDQIKEAKKIIEDINGVNTLTYVSREEALQQMKAQYQEKASLLEGIPEGQMPPSYVVTLTDLSLNEQVQKEITNKIPYLDEILSSNETISTLMGIAKVIRIISMVLLIILVIISIFIISNTIKLTVYARRKEISIMKYVGATNGFIRWPFMVEGIIIGIIAAIISILFVGVIYNILMNKFMASEIVKTLEISFVSFADMFNLIILVYLILGIGIGIIGSSNSMRKYLKV